MVINDKTTLWLDNWQNNNTWTWNKANQEKKDFWKKNLYEQIAKGYEFYIKQLQPDIFWLNELSNKIEKVETIDNINLKEIEKNKELLRNYENKVKQYLYWINKLKDVLALWKEKFNLSNEEERQINIKIKRLEENIKEYKKEIWENKEKFIENLQYKIKTDFEKKKEFYKYQVEIWKLTKEQANYRRLKKENCFWKTIKLIWWYI